MKHFFFRLFSFLSLLVILSQPVLALGGLTALPARLGDDGALLAKPGEVIEIEVRVRNASDVPVRVQTLVEDFVIGEDGKTPIPVVGQRDSRWSLSGWLRLVSSPELLAARESRVIPITITVPQDALPGGRYAMIMHEPLPDQKEAQTSVSQRVGTLLYLRVAGVVNEEAHIRNLTLPSFSEHGPVSLEFAVENLSDVHIRAQAQAIIRDPLGKEVARLELGEQNIFPYTMRSFSQNWNQKWGWGRYTAEVQVLYGSSNQVLTQTTAFWFFPLRLVLFILLALIVIFALVFAIVQRIQHNMKHEREQQRLLEERFELLKKERENTREP